MKTGEDKIENMMEVAIGNAAGIDKAKLRSAIQTASALLMDASGDLSNPDLHDTLCADTRYMSGLLTGLALAIDTMAIPDAIVGPRFSVLQSGLSQAIKLAIQTKKEAA